MTNVNVAQIIKRAVLSEKTYKQMEGGLYTFLVDKRSTKDQIAKAVENQFQVNVTRVNVFKKAAKVKRVTGTRKTTQISGGKKAAVFIKPGQKIEVLSPQKPKSKEKKESKENKPDKSASEAKGKTGLLKRFSKSRSNTSKDEKQKPEGEK